MIWLNYPRWWLWNQFRVLVPIRTNHRSRQFEYFSFINYRRFKVRDWSINLSNSIKSTKCSINTAIIKGLRTSTSSTSNSISNFEDYFDLFLINDEWRKWGRISQEFLEQDTFSRTETECCQVKNSVRGLERRSSEKGERERETPEEKWNKLTSRRKKKSIDWGWKHEGSEKICTKSWYIVCSISNFAFVHAQIFRRRRENLENRPLSVLPRLSLVG